MLSYENLLWVWLPIAMSWHIPIISRPSINGIWWPKSTPESMIVPHEKRLVNNYHGLWCMSETHYHSRQSFIIKVWAQQVLHCCFCVWPSNRLCNPAWEFALTYYGLVMPYGDRDLCQHWARLCFFAWRHQAITRTNDYLSCNWEWLLIMQLRAISQLVLKNSFYNINEKTKS